MMRSLSRRLRRAGQAREGGSFLGTTANFMGSFGVKVGPQFDAFWLDGIAGVSVLNETLNINFIPVSNSQSAGPDGITRTGSE
jgi:hypothetical protein